MNNKKKNGRQHCSAYHSVINVYLLLYCVTLVVAAVFLSFYLCCYSSFAGSSLPWNSSAKLGCGIHAEKCGFLTVLSGFLSWVRSRTVRFDQGIYMYFKKVKFSWTKAIIILLI